MADAKKAIEGEVLSTRELETQVAALESALMSNPQFQQFIQLRNQLNDKYAQVRKTVADIMIPAYQAGEVDKSLKLENGTITVTERDDFEVVESELPPRFWKKVPDTTRIRKTFQLEGSAPKGTKHVKKYGIMLKFKREEG